MSKLGIGLIGCGGRLSGVVELLLKATDAVEVVAVSDPSAYSVQTALERFNPDATVHEDYHDLVKNPQVEWVMIGSWNCFHAEHSLAAFAAGKHVFCEKPLATNLDDCLAIREAMRRSGKHFSIGLTLRYSPHYVRLKELLAEGAIGKLISLEFNETLNWNHGGYIHGDWRRLTQNAGTHLLEKCCHDIDLINWLVDSRAARVASFGGCNFFIPENAHYAETLGKNTAGDSAFMAMKGCGFAKQENPFTAEKDIADNQVAIIEFANQVRGTFHANCSTSIPERRMYFCGSEGTLRADVITGSIEVCRLGFGEESKLCDTGASGGHGGGDDVLAASLAKTMLNGTPPRASLENGLAAAITCFGIDEAMNSGAVVDMATYWSRLDD